MVRCAGLLLYVPTLLNGVVLCIPALSCTVLYCTLLRDSRSATQAKQARGCGNQRIGAQAPARSNSIMNSLEPVLTAACKAVMAL